MTETEILYDKNKNFLIVKCSNETQEKFIKNIGGKIDTKTDNNDTWIVPINKETEIKNYNDSLKKNLVNNSKIVAKSRKMQKKYRRAVSESEDSSENETTNETNDKNNKDVKVDKCVKINRKKNTKKLKSPSKIENSESSRKLSPMETDIIDKIKLAQKIKFEKEKEEYEKNNPELYYKTFNNKPVDFKKINRNEESSDEDIYSSSSAGSESSYSFPSPRTPKKRKKYFEKEEDSYNNLFEEMKEMKKQLYILQIENKKLKSKNLK